MSTIAHDKMTPELARTCIFSFFFQLTRSKDRRVVMTPGETLQHRSQVQAKEQAREASLIEKVVGQASRWFGDRKREEYYQRAGADALAELEGGRDTKGVVNHATGLPEGAGDLGSGREVMRGEDLALAAALPCWGLATIVSQTNETPDGEWIAIAYKAPKVHCKACKSLGRLQGPVCRDCKGKGQRGRGLLGMVRKRGPVSCRTCSGHGRTPGPVCEPCEGQGTIQGWSDEEYETVSRNARLIAREAHRMFEENLMVPDPGLGNDIDTNDIAWQDGQGDALMCRITRKGLQAMYRHMDEHPHLKKVVPILEFAGSEVRKQAPQWAQNEYQNQRS